MDKEICWNITARCNQACKYCHRFLNVKDLTYEENLKILSKLSQSGATEITWTGGEALLVEKVELLPSPEFTDKVNVETLSPVIARTKKEVDGELKTWDLAPSEEQFYRSLENNLINKYKEFNKIEETDKKITISSEMAHVKRKRISIDKNDQKTFHRAYLMDLTLEGDIDLIRFAYDTGLGEKNALGFGMIKI